MPPVPIAEPLATRERYQGWFSPHVGRLTQVSFACEWLGPLAKRADTTTRHGAGKARAWAGPQLDRAGQVLQDDIAPKVSNLPSAAARKVEPKAQRQPRWRKLTAGATDAPVRTS